MRTSALGRRWAALTVCATAVLFGSTAFAGQMKPGSVPGEKATQLPKLAPNAAVFTCETRPFDESAGLFCYGPGAIRKAYGIDSLINKGYTGKGRTIVILDAFGSPSVATDLANFDTVYGLPAPPSLKIITMPGTPAFDPTDADMVGWTGEIALDTQWAHAVAPGANIVLVAAKSDNDEDLLAALNYALDNHLGDVVSMSFGESETFFGNPSGLDLLAAWEKAFTKARAQHVTLFASAGDSGSTQPFDADGDTLPFQNVSWPASSTNVTSVGGTNLFFGTATNADPNGTYQGEQVWNDGFGATGGGMSILIDEPLSQALFVGAAMNKTLHKHRGIADVSYNAGVVGGVITYWSEGSGGAGFYLFGGTSAGSPQWAGIIADLNQIRGRPMGFLNDRINLLGGTGVLRSLFHDVTVGDNGFNGVDGFSAGRGYDLPTGWGTPNFGLLGTTLADPSN
ncbi:MAG TPA: S53 family peptidase [Steroidobacteraceae bacterium]|nr:S53 family peptidase [Steroidobacteraceae bacterium]